MSDETPEPTPPNRRWRWLRREAINLGDFVVQIVAVVIGILLALFINQWNNERQQQAAVSDAMRSIRAELTANRAALHKNAARLYGIAARMQDSPANHQGLSRRPCYLWNQWNGTGVVNVTDAAYQTAMTTQALSNMPFAQAQRIAQVYGKQHLVQKSFYMIRNDILLTSTHDLATCVSALKSFASNERNLNGAYDVLIGPDKANWPMPPPSPNASR